MKLQKRLLLYVGGAALLLFSFVFFLFILLVVSGVQEAEDQYIIENVNRFDSAINEKQDFLARMVYDWAVWDDTYYYVKGDAPEYISRNINEGTYENFGINSIIIINDSGEIVFEGYYNLTDNRELVIPPEVLSEIHSYSDKIKRYHYMKGLASVGYNIVIFASNRVYTSDEKNESGGYMVFAKYFDERDLKAIGNYVGGDVNVSVVGIVYESPDYKEGSVVIGPGIYRRYIENDYVECLREIRDVEGNLIGVAHIISYRGSFVRIISALTYFLAALTLCLIIAGTVFFFVVEKSIVERVLRLDFVIFQILDTADLTKRMADKGDDEISRLSNSFNQLVEIVNANREIFIEKNKILSTQLAALEASTVGLAILNEREEYVYLNRAHANIYGYNLPDELIGKTWRILYNPDELKRFENEIMPVLFKEGHWAGEAVGRKKDSSTFPQWVSLTALPGGGLTCVVKDISQRKESEMILRKQKEELEKANKELRRLDELKSQFLANVSHETRTPLTSIQSYTQILDDELLGTVNAKQKEALGVVLSSSKSLNELLSNILDASKYDSGNVVLSKKQINLYELLCAVRKEFEPALSKIGASMKLELEESLLAFLDEEKMMQVFRNLISNSIKYCGERKLEISISAEKKNDSIAIRFRDNGVGMSKQTLEHIFDRFYRASETSNKVDGAGLGLSIIKSIIELHGGKIEVESRYGEYTQFTITLPKK